MPRQKYNRLAYVSKNHRLDPQMETAKIGDLLSATSLKNLQDIVGKGERHEKYIQASRKRHANAYSHR